MLYSKNIYIRPETVSKIKLFRFKIFSSNENKIFGRLRSFKKFCEKRYFSLVGLLSSLVRHLNLFFKFYSLWL